MQKDIKIGSYEVPMKASAFTPFTYKKEFHADIFADIQKIKDGDFSTLAQIAYVMAYAADQSIGTLEEWLNGFELLDIPEAAPAIIELWGASNKTSSAPRKK